MPRLAARRHSLRFFLLHTHNLIEQERQVLRSPFMCVSYASNRRAYAAASVYALWGTCDASVASHSLFAKYFGTWRKLLRQSKRHIQTSYR